MKASKEIKAGSVVVLKSGSTSDGQKMTVESVDDYFGDRANVVWFTPATVLMKASVNLSALKLVS